MKPIMLEAFQQLNLSWDLIYTTQLRTLHKILLQGLLYETKVNLKMN